MKYHHNMSDEEFIKTLVESRDPNNFVIPLYVKVANKEYALLDMNDIQMKVSKSAFKVGFASKYSITEINDSFPTKLLYNFNIMNHFIVTDPETKFNTEYIILEESYFDEMSDDSLLNKIYEEMNRWIDLLYNRYEEIVNDYIKSVVSIEMNEWKTEEDTNEEDNEEDVYFE